MFFHSTSLQPLLDSFFKFSIKGSLRATVALLKVSFGEIAKMVLGVLKLVSCFGSANRQSLGRITAIFPRANLL